MTIKSKVLFLNASRKVRENSLRLFLSSGYWIKYFAQHTPNNKYTFAVVERPYLIDHKPIAPKFEALDLTPEEYDGMISKSHADLISLGHLTKMFKKHSFPTCTPTLNADLSPQNTENINELHELFKHRATRSLDRSVKPENLLSEALDQISFSGASSLDVIPFVTRLSERVHTCVDPYKVELDLVSNQASIERNIKWLEKHNVEFKLLPSLKYQRSIWFDGPDSFGDYGRTQVQLNLKELNEQSQVITLSTDSVNRMLDVVSDIMGVPPAHPNVFSYTEYIHSDKQSEIGDDIELPSGWYHQRTNDKDAKHYFTYNLNDVFKDSTCFVRTFPKAWKLRCTRDDLPSLIKGRQELRKAGFNRVVIISPDDCDSQYEWVSRAVAKLYETPGNWLYKNPLALDPMFVEKNFVLIPDPELTLSRTLVESFFDVTLKRYLCERAALIVSDLKVIEKRVEANAAQWANVSPESMIGLWKNNPRKHLKLTSKLF